MAGAPELAGRFEPSLLSRVEDAGLNASAPPQQRWMDGWLLRLSPGKAKRARCINALAPGRLPVDAKLALARQAYNQAGLPLIFRITSFSQPEGLDDTLAEVGMSRFDDTRVMFRPSLDGVRPGRLPVDLRFEMRGAEAFAERVGMLRGSPPAQRLAHGQRLLNSPVPYQAFELCRGAELLACGQIAQEAELVGLYDVFTAESARGQGLATLLCARLLAIASERGARMAYLQVDADNHPARAVYRRLGFVDAYRYHYRSDEPAAA